MNNNSNNKNSEWAKIRAEYVNSKISLSKLAEKYGVSKSTLLKKSAKEKWGEERKKKAKRKADKVAEKLHEKDIKQTVKDIERCCNAAGKLIDKINKAINEVDKNVYVSTEEKSVEDLYVEGENGEPNVQHTKKNVKIKTTKYDTLVDTKKISELSKSLLNIKQILTDIDDNTEDGMSGIIEIPAMEVLVPPDESEELDGAADE